MELSAPQSTSLTCNVVVFGSQPCCADGRLRFLRSPAHGCRTQDGRHDRARAFAGRTCPTIRHCHRVHGLDRPAGAGLRGYIGGRSAPSAFPPRPNSNARRPAAQLRSYWASIAGDHRHARRRADAVQVHVTDGARPTCGCSRGRHDTCRGGAGRHHPPFDLTDAGSSCCPPTRPSANTANLRSGDGRPAPLLS